MYLNENLKFYEIKVKTENLFIYLLPIINKKKENLEKIKENISEEWQLENHIFLKEKNFLETIIFNYENLKNNFDSLKELEDFFSKDEIKNELIEIYNNLEKLIFQIKLTPQDKNNCFLHIHSGTGGDDAEDLSNLFLKMYIKWCEKTKKKYEIIDISINEIGIKHATIKIQGENSYGFLKYETGIHRIVRNSPFNTLNKRQTSFVGIEVYEEEEIKKIKIQDSDLEYSFFKASGAGGQHVNKTESAVRLKHIPTGIVVNCQNERSQLMNKNSALELLKIKINKKIKEEKEEKNVKKISISWGNQIRSYVFYPYKLIKDLRTSFETNNIDDFFSGNLLSECLYFNFMFFSSKLIEEENSEKK